MLEQVNPWIDDEEINAVTACLRTGWISEGAYTNKAIGEIKAITNAKYVTLAPNGTLGLFVALLTLDLPRGSEVLVPDFTFFGSCSSIVQAGLVPVPVDVDIETFQICIDDLKRKITSKTSAIMPVHIYGQGADICEIVSLARENSLKVVEDAAQVFGVHYKEQRFKTCDQADSCCKEQRRHLGTFGDIGVFSLFADKTITSGEGGIIVTNSDNIYQKLKLLRNQGRPNSGTFIHPEIGMNFRMTDMQAAILYCQLKKLPAIKAQRLNTYEAYKGAFRKRNIKTMNLAAGSDFIPFRMTALVDDVEAAIGRLEKIDVRARRFFFPMSLQPALKSFSPEKCNGAKYLYDHGICLPIHRDVTLTDIENIAEALASA